MPKLPRDRVVVLTGASSGIGRETALAFARDGARTALGARNRERLEAVAEEIRSAGGETIVVPADVTKRSDVRGLVQSAHRQWGAVHVLINNAGVGYYSPVEKIREEDLDALMRVNVYGPLHAIQEALPIMREQKCGQIINVTSTLGRVPIPFMAAYSMSKFALEALSESLRVEVRPDGIDVIVVGPGLTSTEFQRNARVRDLPLNPARDNAGGVPADSVALAILRASRKRKRRVYLNFDAKLLIFMHGMAPKLTDWGLGRWMRKISSRREKK